MDCEHGGGLEIPLNISTIILQSSCSNLQSFIKPLTMLDNILTSNVNSDNEVLANDKDVKILQDLFDSCTSRKQYVGNQYIWNTFNTFINHKRKIEISIERLKDHCKNEGLLRLILSDIEQEERYQEYSPDKYENKNLLKPQILAMFKNVTHLVIRCNRYPLSLESLLSLIDNTQIRQVNVFGYWLPEFRFTTSFKNISNKYRQANFNMEWEYNNTWLVITYNK